LIWELKHKLQGYGKHRGLSAFKKASRLFTVFGFCMNIKETLLKHTTIFNEGKNLRLVLRALQDGDSCGWTDSNCSRMSGGGIPPDKDRIAHNKCYYKNKILLYKMTGTCGKDVTPSSPKNSFKI
jgi:hypothetical protein